MIVEELQLQIDKLETDVQDKTKVRNLQFFFLIFLIIFFSQGGENPQPATFRRQKNSTGRNQEQ